MVSAPRPGGANINLGPFGETEPEPAPMIGNGGKLRGRGAGGNVGVNDLVMNQAQTLSTLR